MIALNSAANPTHHQAELLRGKKLDIFEKREDVGVVWRCPGIEFLSPQQFSLVMGPGLAAEFSAITNTNFRFRFSSTRNVVQPSASRSHVDVFRCALPCRRWGTAMLSQLEEGTRGFFHLGLLSAFACLSANIAMAFTIPDGKRTPSFTSCSTAS